MSWKSYVCIWLFFDINTSCLEIFYFYSFLTVRSTFTSEFKYNFRNCSDILKFWNVYLTTYQTG